MVGNAVVKREEEAIEVGWEKIRSDEYSELAKVTSGQYLLSTKGLNTLYDLQPFTEIRFDCHKLSHGLRVHLKTTTNEKL